MNLQNYEHFLSSSTTQESTVIRFLLGDSLCATYTVTQKLTANYSHQVSALLAAYRALDLELLHTGPNYFASLPSYQNRITPDMIKKDTVKVRWRKLENWRQILVEFRDLYASLSVKEEDLAPINTSPLRGSIAHLQGLADLHSNQKLASVIQNLRGAALHWTVLHEVTHVDTHRLPVIPESISDIVDAETLRHLNESFQPHTREKMDTYLREHRQGELVLPLHLSLMLSPFFLLMPITLVKSKFPSQSIIQVSVH